MDIVIRFLYQDALDDQPNSLLRMYEILSHSAALPTPDGLRYKEFLEKYLNGLPPANNKTNI